MSIFVTTKKPNRPLFGGDWDTWTKCMDRLDIALDTNMLAPGTDPATWPSAAILGHSNVAQSQAEIGIPSWILQLLDKVFNAKDQSEGCGFVRTFWSSFSPDTNMCGLEHLVIAEMVDSCNIGLAMLVIPNLDCMKVAHRIAAMRVLVGSDDEYIPEAEWQGLQKAAVQLSASFDDRIQSVFRESADCSASDHRVFSLAMAMLPLNVARRLELTSSSSDAARRTNTTEREEQAYWLTLGTILQGRIYEMNKRKQSK